MLVLADTIPWYLNPNLLPAGFGLLGVIIGGLITAASSYFLDRARARREQSKEKQQLAVEVTRAARLIDADFALIESAANTVIQEKRWWPTEPRLLEFKGWHEYRAVIAPQLSFDEWNTLRRAMLLINSLFECRSIAAAAANSDPMYPTMDEAHRDVVTRVKAFVGSARKVLAGYTGYVPPSR